MLSRPCNSWAMNAASSAADGAILQRDCAYSGPHSSKGLFGFVYAS